MNSIRSFASRVAVGSLAAAMLLTSAIAIADNGRRHDGRNYDGRRDHDRNHGGRNHDHRSGSSFSFGFSSGPGGGYAVGSGYTSRGGNWDRRGRNDWRHDRRHNNNWRHDHRRHDHNRFNGFVYWRSAPAVPSWYGGVWGNYSRPAYSYYDGPPRVIVWSVFPTIIYDRMSVRARGYHEAAYWRAMAAPVGQTIAWNDGANAGHIVTTRDGYAGQRYCREFLQDVTVGGRREEAYGTACQTPDGSWQLVANQ